MRDRKRVLRASMRLLRAGCDPAVGVRLAGHVLAGWAPAPGCVVAGYWPLAGEIDVRPLLLAWAGQGYAVALPCTPAAGQGLRFHRWRPGMALEAGRFGTMHPVSEAVRPSVLLVPLLAFDASGGRLGYGGGYYDRTLAALPGAVAIGCGFACQGVERVPCEPHDRPLDAVATELGFARMARGPDLRHCLRDA